MYSYKCKEFFVYIVLQRFHDSMRQKKNQKHVRAKREAVLLNSVNRGNAIRVTAQARVREGALLRVAVGLRRRHGLTVIFMHKNLILSCG